MRKEDLEFDRNLILKAVELHNVYKIPDGLSEKEVLLVKLVRDAEVKRVRTANDLRLFKLTWIFDVNFAVTLKAIRERAYVEKTIAALPQTGDIQKVYHHIMNYLSRF